MARAIRISGLDNVATLLDNGAAGEDVVVLGDKPGVRHLLLEPIAEGHKVALLPIPKGGPVVKFGTVIGTARKPIEPGAWIHLHNCASGYDERSQTLDAQSGAPTDTVYK